jgi:hypothetical protein
MPSCPRLLACLLLAAASRCASIDFGPQHVGHVRPPCLVRVSLDDGAGERAIEDRQLAFRKQCPAVHMSDLGSLAALPHAGDRIVTDLESFSVWDGQVLPGKSLLSVCLQTLPYGGLAHLSCVLHTAVDHPLAPVLTPPRAQGRRQRCHPRGAKHVAGEHVGREVHAQRHA